jgi:alkylated DNA nucleotide flippase Atl1
MVQFIRVGKRRRNLNWQRQCGAFPRWNKSENKPEKRVALKVNSTGKAKKQKTRAKASLQRAIQSLGQEGLSCSSSSRINIMTHRYISNSYCLLGT